VCPEEERNIFSEEKETWRDLDEMENPVVCPTSVRGIYHPSLLRKMK
jgi:hypothetical protein